MGHFSFSHTEGRRKSFPYMQMGEEGRVKKSNPFSRSPQQALDLQFFHVVAARP